MIDLYCERLAPGLGAEPINALTNLAFLVSAWATWRLMRRRAERPASVGILPALMVAVAVGSGLFHTLATPWARVLDVLPILLFQVVCVWLYARRILALGRPGAAGIVGAFLLVALIGRPFPTVLCRATPRDALLMAPVDGTGPLPGHSGPVAQLAGWPGWNRDIPRSTLAVARGGHHV